MKRYKLKVITPTSSYYYQNSRGKVFDILDAYFYEGLAKLNTPGAKVLLVPVELS